MSNQKQPLFLRIFKDGQLVDVKQFPGPQVIIGREGQIDLAINDPGVSPIHAMIEERGEGRYFLCDLGGQSGTLVNGQKIVDAALESGSEFQLGSHKIEFHIGVPKPKKTAPTQAATAPSAPPQSIPKQAPPVAKAQPPPVAAKPAAIPKDVPKKPLVTTTVKQTTTAAAGMAPATRTPLSKVPPPLSKTGTYAPVSNADLQNRIKPGTGGVIQIVLSWKDKVLNTYHYDRPGIINIGSHPKNEIILPVFGSVRNTFPILKLEPGNTTVFIASDMTGEVVKDKTTSTFEELRRQNRMVSLGSGYSYNLQQNELIRIQLGEGVVLTICYVAPPPASKLIPFIDLSVNQLTGLVLGLIGMALFLLWTFIYSPAVVEEPEEEQIPPRKAQFYYRRPVQEIAEAPKTSAEKSIKDKEVAPARGEEGAAQEAAPNKSQSTKQIPTTPKAGTGKGIQKVQAGKKADSAPKAPKDVSNTGVLGIFATKGVQEQLNKAAQGAGAVAGMSKDATGAGAEAAGAGNTPGSGLKEIGAGGKGTATYGIAGVKTKGRGGGLTGYGTGSLGAKKNASIVAGGEDAIFTGSIDKEAIRRVVLANLKQIKACYEKGLNRDPSLYGKIVIQWTIGPGGRVTEARTKSTTMNSSEVENCAVARLRTWKFPEPPAGELADVAYPFVFQAQE